MAAILIDQIDSSFVYNQECAILISSLSKIKIIKNEENYWSLKIIRKSISVMK